MRAEENGNSECRSEGINVLEKKSTKRLITRLKQNWDKFQHYFSCQKTVGSCLKEGLKMQIFNKLKYELFNTVMSWTMD